MENKFGHDSKGDVKFDMKQETSTLTVEGHNGPLPVQSKSNPLKTQPWTPEESAELYGINNWGNGYYRVNSNGNVQITPTGLNGPSVDLYELTQDLLDRGIRVPIMIRFTDIIKARVELLHWDCS